MSCYYPSLALNLGKNEEGKNIIKFLPHRVDLNVNQLREIYGDRLLMLPCGSCLGCKFDKAKDWATRCYLESLEHEENCFITLTYDDDHLPLKLYKPDVLDFIKKMRNAGYKVRYLISGELGELTRRPHFHLCLFGYFPKDAEVFGRSKDGFTYTSKEVSEFWENKGHCLICAFNFNTAGYVARYTTKKIGDDGSFITMSLKPGIGMNWITKKENQDLVFEYDKIPGKFGSLSFTIPPRAFDKYLEKVDPVRYERLRERRLERAANIDLSRMNHLKLGHVEQLKSYQSTISDSKLKKFERSAV